MKDTVLMAMRLLRVRDWVKNVFVLAALVFSGRLGSLRSVILSLVAFAAFCALSSATYVFNDICDREDDRKHPLKRQRPVASGQVGVAEAGIASVLCLAIGVLLCVAVGRAFLVVGTLLVLLNVLYTVALKRLAIADVMCIASGFALRSFAGGVAIGVPVSVWLLVCTFTLCMFLGFGKRRCELAVLKGGEATSPDRSALGVYSLPLLDQLLAVCGGLAILTYVLYTIDSATVAKLGTPYMLFSSVFVVYCVFRFAMLVEAGQTDGPVRIITTDKPFILSLLLWTAYAVVIIRWGPALRQALEGKTAFLDR